ncbi:MAG: surface-adhesin E family protein [Limnohabitans sp.]
MNLYTYFIQTAIGMCVFCTMLGGAQAEWAELLKDDDITYVWDKDSVRAVHVSRIAWTMTNLTAKGVKAPNGEEYLSSLARWRINCKTDSFVKLSESFYAKADGKGREVAFYEAADWRPRDAAIRPGSYLSLLKKQICTSSPS